MYIREMNWRLGQRLRVGIKQCDQPKRTDSLLSNSQQVHLDRKSARQNEVDSYHQRGSLQRSISMANDAVGQVSSSSGRYAVLPTAS
jgi:hypothetical protein